MTQAVTDVRLAPLDAIPPGEGRVCSLRGEDVAVFRTRAGDVFACQAACPHKGGPLADGLVGGTTMICPLHAWKFDLTTGAALTGECGVKTFPVRVNDDGWIVLSLERPE